MCTYVCCQSDSKDRMMYRMENCIAAFSAAYIRISGRIKFIKVSILFSSMHGQDISSVAIPKKNFYLNVVRFVTKNK